MFIQTALDAELRQLVAWSDYHALRDRREQEAAPHIQKIAEKHGASESLVWARFWMFVGIYARITRVGHEPSVDANGSLRKGKHGSRRLMMEARGCLA